MNTATCICDHAAAPCLHVALIVHLMPAGGLEAQSGLAAITDALKAYRPGATVLEAEVSKARGPLIGGTNAASTHSLGRMMVTKRAAHGQTISASKRRKVDTQVRRAVGSPLQLRPAGLQLLTRLK